jgi:hypothetical protein
MVQELQYPDLTDLEIQRLLMEESPENQAAIMREVAELEAEMDEGEFSAAAVAQARHEQALMAGFNHGEASMRDGEVTMRVHPLFWHYWAQRLGPECWNDKGFVREFLRDNEAVRVKNVRPNPVITSNWESKKRSTTNYGRI